MQMGKNFNGVDGHSTGGSHRSGSLRRKAGSRKSIDNSLSQPGRFDDDVGLFGGRNTGGSHYSQSEPSLPISSSSRHRTPSTSRSRQQQFSREQRSSSTNRPERSSLSVTSPKPLPSFDGVKQRSASVPRSRPGTNTITNKGSGLDAIIINGMPGGGGVNNDIDYSTHSVVTFDPDMPMYERSRSDVSRSSGGKGELDDNMSIPSLTSTIRRRLRKHRDARRHKSPRRRRNAPSKEGEEGIADANRLMDQLGTDLGSPPSPTDGSSPTGAAGAGGGHKEKSSLRDWVGGFSKSFRKTKQKGSTKQKDENLEKTQASETVECSPGIGLMNLAQDNGIDAVRPSYGLNNNNTIAEEYVSDTESTKSLRSLRRKLTLAPLSSEIAGEESVKSMPSPAVRNHSSPSSQSGDERDVRTVSFSKLLVSMKNNNNNNNNPAGDAIPSSIEMGSDSTSLPSPSHRQGHHPVSILRGSNTMTSPPVEVGGPMQGMSTSLDKKLNRRRGGQGGYSSSSSLPPPSSAHKLASAVYEKYRREYDMGFNPETISESPSRRGGASSVASGSKLELFLETETGSALDASQSENMDVASRASSDQWSHSTDSCIEILVTMDQAPTKNLEVSSMLPPREGSSSNFGFELQDGNPESKQPPSQIPRAASERIVSDGGISFELPAALRRRSFESRKSNTDHSDSRKSADNSESRKSLGGHSSDTEIISNLSMSARKNRVGKVPSTFKPSSTPSGRAGGIVVGSPSVVFSLGTVEDVDDGVVSAGVQSDQAVALCDQKVVSSTPKTESTEESSSTLHSDVAVFAEQSAITPPSQPVVSSTPRDVLGGMSHGTILSDDAIISLDLKSNPMSELDSSTTKSSNSDNDPPSNSPVKGPRLLSVKSICSPCNALSPLVLGPLHELNSRRPKVSRRVRDSVRLTARAHYRRRLREDYDRFAALFEKEEEKQQAGYLVLEGPEQRGPIGDGGYDDGARLESVAQSGEGEQQRWWWFIPVPFSGLPEDEGEADDDEEHFEEMVQEISDSLGASGDNIDHMCVVYRAVSDLLQKGKSRKAVLILSEVLLPFLRSTMETTPRQGYFGNVLVGATLRNIATIELWRGCYKDARDALWNGTSRHFEDGDMISSRDLLGQTNAETPDLNILDEAYSLVLFGMSQYALTSFEVAHRVFLRAFSLVRRIAQVHHSSQRHETPSTTSLPPEQTPSDTMAVPPSSPTSSNLTSTAPVNNAAVTSVLGKILNNVGCSFFELGYYKRSCRAFHRAALVYLSRDDDIVGRIADGEVDAPYLAPFDSLSGSSGGDDTSSSGSARLDLAGTLRQLSKKARDITPPFCLEASVAFCNLAHSLVKVDKSTSSVPLLREAIFLQESALGKDHDIVFSTAESLAFIYIRLSLYDNALLIYDSMLKVEQSKFATSKSYHKHMAKLMGNMAYVYLKKDKLKLAQCCLQGVLANQEASLPKDHHTIQQTKSFIAEIEEKLRVRSRGESGTTEEAVGL